MKWKIIIELKNEVKMKIMKIEENWMNVKKYKIY